jgi:putative transposase
MNRKRDDGAVFWCGLLSALIFGQMEPAEEQEELKRLAGEEVLYPNGVRRMPSLRTLKRKLAAYRKGGFDSLLRKQRADRGKPRRRPEELFTQAIALKIDQPRRSPEMINLILQERTGKTIPRSTLYRHFKKAGATRKRLGVSTKPVRKRWTVERTHDMWLGDFSHGPYVLVNGQSVPTRLSAFIDVHSRYIVIGRYYLSENLDILCDTLVRGFAAHGLPLALYVDNARVYHSRSLKKACYRLGINLLHRKPRDPEGGGLIERFFQTVQNQFESEVRAGEQLGLARLNETFTAWLNVQYHASNHSEIKQSPQERYTGRSVRTADMNVVAMSFMQSDVRTVNPVFSDVRLFNQFYRADPKLRSERVEVRYDPFGSFDKVLLFSLEGESLGAAVRHERQEGEPKPPEQKASHIDILGTLVDRHNRLQEEETVDFRNALTARTWPFETFATCLAGLLGRKGALSAFTVEELKQLQTAYQRLPNLTRTKLEDATASANEKTIAGIIHHLQGAPRS